MNDQRVKYCATCFTPFHYERSTAKFCSDLCRVTDFNKNEAKKRREEYLYNICKGSDVIEAEMIVEDAPETDIAADSNTLLTPEQENSIPLSVTVEEQHAKFLDKFNENSRKRNRGLAKTELNLMAKLINAVYENIQGSNS